MKLQTKIFILLAIVIGTIILTFFALQVINLKQKELFDSENEKSREFLIDKIQHLNSERFIQTAKDNSGWDDMVVFAEKPDKDWAKINVDYLVTSFKMSFTLVYNKEKELSYRYCDSVAIIDSIFFERTVIDSVFSNSAYCHFFHYFGKELYEIFGATIVPSSDLETRKSIPQGYMFVAKRWSTEYLHELELATGFNPVIYSKLKIDESNKFSDDDNIYIFRNLNDYLNNDLAVVVFSCENSLKKEFKTFFYMSIAITFSAVITIFLFLFFFRKIVLNPLSKITKALKTNSTKPIDSLKNSSDEFGRLTILVLQFFKQKEKLKEIYSELLQKNHEISIQRDSLDELNATKDNFFSIIAHDLKNPFNTILGFSELLLQNVKDYNKNEIELFASHIHSSASRTHDLLNNLLLWASLQRGKMAFKPESVDVNEICSEIFEYLKPTSDNKEISLKMSFEEKIQIFADKNMLSTVLRNLVSNAIKFTDVKGNIEVKLSSSRKDYEFSVEDNGVGMKDELIKTLFKIDTTITSTGTAHEKGTGLGLVLCKEFIEKHGGKIWVESEFGNGTRFKFTIPKILTIS